MPWFGDNHLRACTTCKVGFVVPSDDADFWKPSVVRGEQRFEVKLGCPKCRLTAKEQRRVRLLRGGSPASSSTSDVVRRSPPPTPSIAPSASEVTAPNLKPQPGVVSPLNLKPQSRLGRLHRHPTRSASKVFLSRNRPLSPSSWTPCHKHSTRCLALGVRVLGVRVLLVRWAVTRTRGP